MSALDPERAEALVERMRGVRVLVVGDVMLDRYVVGTVDRVSPEAPVPVVRVESEHTALGGAANVAANVAALGGACEVVGCVGEDAAGEELLGTLAATGISVAGIVRTPARPTTVKTRVLAHRQQIVRIDREVDGEVEAHETARIVDAVGAGAGASDVLVAQDYNKGVLAPRVIAAVRESAAAHDVPWVVDPKRISFFSYEGATVFKPNARELADALGERLRADDADWMEGVRRRLACHHLLLTLGERGMSLQSYGEQLVRLPTVAREVFDVSGAGDTVTAVVALAHAAGASVAEAAALANHAAAVEVGKSGVRTVSPTELLEHVRSHAQPDATTASGRTS